VKCQSGFFFYGVANIRTAAGVAAALSVKQNKKLCNIDVKDIQTKLGR